MGLHGKATLATNRITLAVDCPRAVERHSIEKLVRYRHLARTLLTATSYRMSYKGEKLPRASQLPCIDVCDVERLKAIRRSSDCRHVGIILEMLCGVFIEIKRQARPGPIRETPLPDHFPQRLGERFL